MVSLHSLLLSIFDVALPAHERTSIRLEGEEETLRGESRERLVDLAGGIRRPLLRAGCRLLAAPVEQLLGIRSLNAVHRRLEQRLARGEEFFSAALREGSLGCVVGEEEMARIPATGPVIVVANHPFGGVDGIVLGALLGRRRQDFKLLANGLLGRLRGILPWLLPVNPFGGKGAAGENLRALRQALRHLQAGGCLAAFPAGEVSSFRWSGRRVMDVRWSSHVARLARQTGATVVPVFFQGSNSWLFQLAGLVHPRARTVLLVRELLRRRGSVVRARVGQPIPFAKMGGFATDEALTEFFRLKTYALRSAEEPLRSRRFFPGREKSVREMATIIPAVSPEWIREEIARLPEEAKLAEGNGLAVYHFHGEALPHTLREIGRLRELSFRAVGEGSGKACDLDEFDPHYEHLVLYDEKAVAVVGAYRLGLSDVLLRRFGQRGLYTSTLFHFRSAFFEKLDPAIELGRSFVRPEYQRKPACVPLLWRGITAFVARRPRYTRLFGPVSVNPQYHAFSRRLIEEFLRRKAIAADLAPLVRAKNPPRRINLDGADLATLLEANFEVEDLSTLVAGLEEDGKPVPVLLKHYLRLNGQMIAFNVDPDFGECLDGLILVDLLRVEPKLLRAHMGAEAAEDFLRFHAKTPTGNGGGLLPGWAGA